MIVRIGVWTKTVTRGALTVSIALVASQAPAQTVTGTATYRERVALPPGAVFEATIEDVSLADAPATVIASMRNTSPGNPPIAFTIAYDAEKIVASHDYSVRATITLDGRLLFTSDTRTSVITRGHPTNVSIMLRSVSTGTTAQTPSARATPSFEGTCWKAVQLEGKPVPSNNSVREAHLVFDSGGASGSDGCNRVRGAYHQTDPDGLTFGEMLSTQMSCAGTGEVERAFRSVMKDTRHWRIDNGHLELLDANSARLAIFDAEARR